MNDHAIALKPWPRSTVLLAGHLLVGSVCAAAMQPGTGEALGRGATAAYEQAYLVYVIDHHYSALRMTELAAGTDHIRDATVVNPAEGTSPTPGFGATTARATDEQIRSLARQGNRTQREEIGTAQRMLRMWYGVRHEPVLTQEGRQMIQQMEQVPAGAQFDQAFLRMFVNHHFTILAPSVHCQVQSDLQHGMLQRYCENIVVSQKNQINNMRELLCRRFGDCGFAPPMRPEQSMP